MGEAGRHSSESRPEVAAQLLEGLLAEGEWPGEIPQALTHNLATALRQTVQAKLMAGDPAAAIQETARALDVPLPPELPPERLRGRAEILFNIGSDFMHAGQMEQAQFCLRRAIALYPCPTFSNNLINVLDKLRRPSVLADYCDTLELKEIAPRILLASQPKSGSTFLHNVLQEITGWRDVYFCHHTELASQDLFYPTLLEFAQTPTVSHQHIRATEANVQLMQAFAIRPVILVRNLYDVVLSLRDYFTGGAIRGTLFNVDAWMHSTPERQADQIIDLVVPWHLEFLASWQRADRDGRLPVLWMRYEEMLADKPAAVRRILEWQGLKAEDERIAAAVAKVEQSPEKNRFNKGVSGRGREGLTVEQKERIRRMMAYYPEADFRAYGAEE
jgi:tetratricopeptide (TPR) repeat protein